MEKQGLVSLCCQHTRVRPVTWLGGNGRASLSAPVLTMHHNALLRHCHWPHAAFTFTCQRTHWNPASRTSTGTTGTSTTRRRANGPRAGPSRRRSRRHAVSPTSAGAGCPSDTTSDPSRAALTMPPRRYLATRVVRRDLEPHGHGHGHTTTASTPRPMATGGYSSPLGRVRDQHNWQTQNTPRKPTYTHSNLAKRRQDTHWRP